LRGFTKTTDTSWKLGWMDGQKARARFWRFILKAQRGLGAVEEIEGGMMNERKEGNEDGKQFVEKGGETVTYL
jgi:hypothetical protein